MKNLGLIVTSPIALTAGALFYDNAVLLVVSVVVLIGLNVLWIWLTDPYTDVITKFLDSYDHYHYRLALGRFHSIYRALYYEIKHKEPWA